MPMQSRTDQVHSYQFFLQRVVSGLVAKESDPAELPFRRLGWAGFGSVMLTVLLAAGFGVYGVLVGGGATAWRDGRSVIVERESGQAYLYREERLHPMLNVVSAQLALGGNANVRRVSARSLADVPRGVTLGIPGAPASLPGPQRLLSPEWTLCTQRRPDGRGGQETISALALGRGAEGGTPLVGEQALLVRDAGHELASGPGDLHLLWRGQRYLLAVSEPSLRVLGVRREQALPVAPAWLDALPVGAPLRAPASDERGGATRALGELPEELAVRTGQVIETAGVHYLVRDSELAELTPLMAALLLAEPATAEAYPDRAPVVRVDVPAVAIANAPVEPLPAPTATSAPEHLPPLQALAPEELRDAAVCASFDGGELVPRVWTGARLPWASQALATPRVTGQGGLLADYVLVAGGHAALVQAVATPQATAGAWQLVTDQGVRYPLAGPEVAGMLGYDQGHVVRMPAGLLARLPAGPALDPAAALQPAGPGAAGGQ